jgi:hypothetical protein
MLVIRTWGFGSIQCPAFARQITHVKRMPVGSWLSSFCMLAAYPHTLDTPAGSTRATRLLGECLLRSMSLPTLHQPTQPLAIAPQARHPP